MGAQARILVVEDDPEFAEIEARALRRNGYAVEIATTGAAALASIRKRLPDLALLDYQLPDMDGFEVLDELKAGADEPPMPVLFLTAESSPDQQVIGLDNGAADFMAKDGDMSVILARIRTALRKANRHPGPLRRGNLEVDPLEATVELDGRRLHLDRKPMLVLHRLMQSEGQVVTREALLDEIWSTNFAGYGRSLDQAVYVIRKALGRPDWITTVQSTGFRFQVPPPRSS